MSSNDFEFNVTLYVYNNNNTEYTSMCHVTVNDNFWKVDKINSYLYFMDDVLVQCITSNTLIYIFFIVIQRLRKNVAIGYLKCIAKH